MEENMNHPFEETQEEVEKTEEIVEEKPTETTDIPKEEEVVKESAPVVPPKTKAPIWVIVVSLVLSLFGGFGGAALYRLIFGGGKTVIYQTVTNENPIVHLEPQDMTNVVADVKESVVEILTESVQTSQFFGEYVTEGAGSGVIISKDGYIVTNNHVIEGSTKITVTLANGTMYDATLIGTDPQTDLAVIKVDANDLTYAILGSSDNLMVGQDIFAIGNPLGTLGGSVSEGIISALSRQMTIDDVKLTLLQITAAVNPGNSGGGLFNLNGELVGIVNAKSSGSGIEGLGFAIPIDTAKPVVEDLISYGYVTGRPQLGITYVVIDSRQLAFQYGVNQLGVYIYEVREGSAADKAGLKAGDMILAVNDKEVDLDTTLSSLIMDYKVGDVVSILVFRDGITEKFDVTLEEYKAVE